MDIPGPALQAAEEALRKAKREQKGGTVGGDGSDDEQKEPLGGSGGGNGGGDDHNEEEEDEEEEWETESSEDDDMDDEDGQEDNYEIGPNDFEYMSYHSNLSSDLSSHEDDHIESASDGEEVETVEDDEVGDDEGGDDGFEDIEDDSDVDEDMDEGPDIQDDDKKIEELNPRTRAVFRPIYPDEDVMSDFSGDEKYAPKEFISGNDGEGDQDMIDFSVYEETNDDDPEFYKLTTKIRELMLNLKKGRAERERKLGNPLGYRHQHQHEICLEDSPDPPMSSPYVSKAADPAPFLHRLLVRGQGHPREVEHSPAISNHYQCANSMTITPSTMGLWDDIFTVHLHSIMRCGVLERNTFPNYNRRMMANLTHEHPWADVATRKAVLKPYAKPLRTVEATKFLNLFTYRFDQLPESHDYVRLEEEDDPLCLAHRYGYLAHGAASGSVVVYCTQCEEEPHEIHNAYLADELDLEDIMVNSLEIVRWNRYHRSQASSQDGGVDSSDQDRDDDSPLEGYDEKDGFPSEKTGQFDHFLLMAVNDGGLFIAALPDHPDPKQAHHHELDHNDMPKHTFKYRNNHTWIRAAFGETFLNDAKVSPNGRWIAVVGDSAQVWVIEVSHVPETEEQRIEREDREREMDIEELETDGEYNTEDELMQGGEPSLTSKEFVTATKAAFLEAALADFSPRGAKRPRGSEDSPSDNDDENSIPPKSPKPTTVPRLLHLFGQPQELIVPDKVMFTAKHKKNRQPRGPEGVAGGGGGGGNGNNNPFGGTKVSFQYVAWNATSTKFAHSSDTCSRVVVWSMPSREIVCCVDTGGPAYYLEFHPRLENLFAVANWYGFVHIVDIKGACVGDQDLVVSDTRYNGQAKEGGPGLAGCEGPHYEEKHDILMVSFRGQNDMRLRILDGIRGLGWSSDGRYLYVSTLRRVLRYEVADRAVRVPSLFELCGRKVKEWKEREIQRVFTRETEASVQKAFWPMPKEWRLVPYAVKKRIWGEGFLMRSHSG
ncbi:hypothetical protein BGZ95_004747 [Linnemannia exigua]|uniref:Uncharacterized protein n=1 Tax=Linnemannia exigua TaxID=604196 RepID=A0AAD4D352_9FUNG|nr:hypothetical protein BGZ95_004747 [Linnemannia exigua]